MRAWKPVSLAGQASDFCPRDLRSCALADDGNVVFKIPGTDRATVPLNKPPDTTVVDATCNIAKQPGDLIVGNASGLNSNLKPHAS